MITNDSLKVQEEAHRLMASLAERVPGELGRIVKAIVGVDDGGTDAGGHMKPPAGPIGWASDLISLCCQTYGVPIEKSIPVGACFELLGIASAALDAAQDNHHDLLSIYGVAPSFVSISETESKALKSAKPFGAIGGTSTRCHDAGSADWSKSTALVTNAGVTLIALFWQALLEHGPRYGVESPVLLEIGQLIAVRLVEICHGQHLDLTARFTPDITLETYDRLLEGKTGAIDGLACEAGAVLAGAVADRLLWRTLGMERAVAQQLYDDYVDLAEDLIDAGKIGHPVLYGLAVGDPDQKSAILDLIERARSGMPAASDGMQELSNLLQDLGAEYYTLTCMTVHRNRALAALEALQLPSEAREVLQGWVLSADPLSGPSGGKGLELVPPWERASSENC